MGIGHAVAQCALFQFCFVLDIRLVAPNSSNEHIHTLFQYYIHITYIQLQQCGNALKTYNNNNNHDDEEFLFGFFSHRVVALFIVPRRLYAINNKHSGIHFHCIYLFVVVVCPEWNGTWNVAHVVRIEQQQQEQHCC